MTIVFLGVAFVVMAVFHLMGSPFFLSKRYRDRDFSREFQKGLIFPYAFLGAEFNILLWRFDCDRNHSAGFADQE